MRTLRDFGRCHFHYFAHWRKVRNFIALDFAPVIPRPTNHTTTILHHPIFIFHAAAAGWLKRVSAHLERNLWMTLENIRSVNFLH